MSHVRRLNCCVSAIYPFLENIWKFRSTELTFRMNIRHFGGVLLDKARVWYIAYQLTTAGRSTNLFFRTGGKCRAYPTSTLYSVDERRSAQIHLVRTSTISVFIDLQGWRMRLVLPHPTQRNIHLFIGGRIISEVPGTNRRWMDGTWRSIFLRL